VTLAVQAGEMVALTGPSGSGKSTLLNLAGLIDRPDAGEIFLRGQPITGLDETRATRLRRDAIGFVFQGFNLVPVMTVAENVDYPLLLKGLPRNAANAWRRCCTPWACTGMPDTGPTRSPAASASAWPSHGPWSSARAW
jgi:putative ABC transport system ATP-binding protein